MTEERRFKLSALSKTTFLQLQLSGSLGQAYQIIGRLMGEEVLSNEEFDFWAEVSEVLTDANVKLGKLRSRAD